jgi:protein ImuB
MRILGINLQVPQEPSCAEAFLKLSPRVQFRAPFFIFIDIESTAFLLGGESKLLDLALNIAKSFEPTATAAIADTAPHCQVLCRLRPSLITKPGFDYEVLNALPIQALLNLEGLEAWSKVSEVEHVISFFQMLGIHRIQEVMHFKLASFRERWGSFGVTLWNRLHQKEVQVISPLEKREPLYGYAHFDEPVSTVNHLLQKLAPSLRVLFYRLEGLCRFAQKLHLTLFCEYSEIRRFISIEPVSASRDFELFHDLLLRKLDELSLDNPIRDYEIEVEDIPEKSEQLDFFETSDSSEDRWRRLISFANQASCEMGFLQVEASHFPEKSYSMKTDWPKDFSPQDLVAVSPETNDTKDKAIMIKSVYAKGLAKSPRPSLLLNQPEPLSKSYVSRMQKISRIPIERIDSSWWDWKQTQHKNRDYYFAMSEEGQMLWVYQDRVSKQYYLHGYFD